MMWPKKSAVFCFVAGILSVFQGKIRSFSFSPLQHLSRHGTCEAAHVMNQYGSWKILQSNDPLVSTLPSPCIVELSPGKFKIGNTVFGSFQFETNPPYDKGGIYVSMSMFNIGILKKVYNLVPMNTDRMALFGTGSRAKTYYLLERLRHDEHLADL